jgi:hypothetical protein
MLAVALTSFSYLPQIQKAISRNNSLLSAVLHDKPETRRDSSLHSITDCAAIAGLLGLFLSALRFRVAVIFNGLYEALSTPRGGLPNQALASTSLGFVGDGLFMSVPSGSPMRCNAPTMHVGASEVWSLKTYDLLKEMPAASSWRGQNCTDVLSHAGQPVRGWDMKFAASPARSPRPSPSRSLTRSTAATAARLRAARQSRSRRRSGRISKNQPCR